MNLQTQIQQQQATVHSLEKLIRAKRCTQAELNQARARLADLRQQVNFKPLAALQTAPPEATSAKPEAPTPVGRLIEGDEYIRLQADLSSQADRLNRKMADLSNKLHQVPPGVSCPELVKPILDLKAQIEAIWDKKRYLERNRTLPEETVDDEPDTEQSLDMPALLDEAIRFKLAYDKRRLIDQRSKLKSKLANPKAKPGKINEWETELAKVNWKIQEIETRLI